MLMEVVDPEPLTGDHVPFRKETGKSEFMEGEREGWLWKKGDSVSQKRLSPGKGNRQGLRSLLFEGLCQSM